MIEIARRVGVSRERMRQLKRFLPERRWVKTGEMADFASDHVIRKWVAEGHVDQAPSGLVDRRQVEDHYVELVERGCEYLDCTEMVGSIDPRYRFCVTHSFEVRVYRYPVMSPEERQRHHVATGRWREEHPEQSREINHRACAKWRAKRKQAEQQGTVG